MGPVMATCMEVMDRPWEWGAADCCTAACDVFLRLYGVDPMAQFRGRYSSRVGALRIIAQAGGFIDLAQGFARSSGLVASDGRVGDFGVILTGDEMAFGIRTEFGWVGKSEGGLAVVSNFKGSWACHQSSR